MARYPETIERWLGILTTAGWVTGMLRVPKLHTLADFIDSGHDFLKLSDVKLPHIEEKLPFLALHRDAAMFIAPLDEHPAHDTLPISAATTQRDVACLFEDCILVGKLDVVSGVRVSDYLMHRSGFIPLRDCELRGAAYLPPDAKARFKFALVNRQQILGVAENAEADRMHDFTATHQRDRLRVTPPRYRDV